MQEHGGWREAPPAAAEDLCTTPLFLGEVLFSTEWTELLQRIRLGREVQEVQEGQVMVYIGRPETGETGELGDTPKAKVVMLIMVMLVVVVVF